jgi:hypothetical protein
MKPMSTRSRAGQLRRAIRDALFVASIAAAAPALAIDFQNESGSVSGSWDTTLTYGYSWRVESRDERLIATSASKGPVPWPGISTQGPLGGLGRSPNIDDGNLNFDTGTVSNAVKFLTEIGVNYEGRFGFFARAKGLYDTELEDQPRKRTQLTEDAKSQAASYVQMLDSFVWGRFSLGDMPFELRVGDQVLNWGESTFIQGGIGIINHFDVSALRVPGAELKEALLPQDIVWASLGITENTTIEAFYQYDWDNTEPEPVGTYFAANDFAAAGGKTVFLGFGRLSDLGTDFRPLGGSVIEDFQGVARTDTRSPDDQGQFGVALRLFAPNFSGGTEFGVYYVNYHSRLPLISGTAGTQAGIGNATGAAVALQGAAQSLAAGLPFDAAVAGAANAAVASATQVGGTYTLAQATEAATIGANAALLGGDVQSTITALATDFIVHEFSQTANYFTEFPEDIDVFGLSFNTVVGTTGIALQGELAYRPNQPLQFDDVELLFGALTPLRFFPNPAVGQRFQALADFGQLGGFNPGAEVAGWDEFETFQYQMTATRTFAQVLGASQLVLVGEAGVFYVSDMPGKTSGGPNGQGIRFNGPGTSVSGNAALSAFHFGEVEPLNRFADSTSWGYRIAGRLDYTSFIGPWNMLPRFAWSHDVKGTSPGPGGNFVEGRNSLLLGVSFNYQNTWDVDFSYTMFNGAGRYNDLNDRDFIAFAVKYAF